MIAYAEQDEGGNQEGGEGWEGHGQKSCGNGWRAAQDFCPERPAERRCKTNDSSIEKIVELLRDNPRGLLYFRDELIALFKRMEQAISRTGHSCWKRGTATAAMLMTA